MGHPDRARSGVEGLSHRHAIALPVVIGLPTAMLPV